MFARRFTALAAAALVAACSDIAGTDRVHEVAVAMQRTNAALLKVILDMALDLGEAVFERQSLALKDRPDSRPTLGTITCPSIVVCGREDALCPPAYHEAIADGIPQARLTILDDCGHMPPLERPRATSRLLNELIHETGNHGGRAGK